VTGNRTPAGGRRSEPDDAGSARENIADVPPERMAAAAFVRREAARILGVDPVRLPDGRSLIAQGLDSLGAAELAGAIESGLGVQVSFASLLEGASLAELGETIAERLAAEAAPDRPAPEVAATAPGADSGVAARRPLAHGQRALWLLDRMVPGGNPA
jgi:acyl carrier protein